ncbi:MAG: iron-containing alcohol dehydrogenase [Desulfurivibrio sp.]|jgi:alcohol dehydrogenase class IV|nr:MAG: iron-containing alcohol dehydrogenase [Desulfurivibrio sp.]
MQELRKFVAPEFVFGCGSLNLVGRYANNFGAEKVLIVSDPGVIVAGWCGKVQDVLAAAGIASVVFSAVSANPRAEEVMAGAEFYRSHGCDVIVAVGGGSAIDCAKGIGIVSMNRRHILQFAGIDNVTVPGPPLICIPTTAGSSADVSQFAIITDLQERVKVAIISKTVVPDVALIDPATTVTMDAYLTACTGIDAMVHAIEAFVSTAHSALLDIHALEAIRLIRANLQDAIANPADLELRSRLMQASLEAGLAFSNASLGAVHAMAHSLGGFLDRPHGECNAILLDHVVSFNYESSVERYLQIGEALGLDMRGMPAKEKRAAVLNAIASLKHASGVDKTLREKGIRLTDIPELAEKALRDPCLVTNPRRFNKRDIEVIYAEAL